MLNDLLIWGALLVGLVFLVVDKRRRTGALTLAYFLDLSLGHVPGVLAYLDPNFLDEGTATKIGFNATLIGMSAFIVGAMAARILPRRTMSAKAYQQTASPQIFSRYGWRVLTVGITSFFVILPASALVPSLTAISSAMGALLILGLWFLLYAAVTAKNGQWTLIFAMLPLLPLATLVTGGFIGYGTVWALGVVAFYFCIARRRVWFYLLTPPAVFIGLSLFVTYASQRDEIRDVIWYQNSGIIQRLEQVSKLVTDFQFLDLSNPSHLFALDDRLNQNYIVGEGIMQHRQGETELQYGATLPLWALIPRVIWPDKPAVGGGGYLVSQFTGIGFEEGTSVGIGQVLEFYINFGMPGILAGFAVFGFILMRLDQRMMRAFAMGNTTGVTQTALPGLAMLMPLGNLMEILVAVASAIIASQALTRLKFLDASPTQRPSAKTSAQKMRTIGLR
jgi:hypothetical protein